MGNKILNVILNFTLILLCVILFAPNKCDQVLMYFSIFISFLVIISNNDCIKGYGGAGDLLNEKIDQILKDPKYKDNNNDKLFLILAEMQNHFGYDVSDVSKTYLKNKPIKLEDLDMFKCSGKIKQKIVNIKPDKYPKNFKTDAYSLKYLAQLINDIKKLRIDSNKYPGDVTFFNNLVNNFEDRSYTMSSRYNSDATPQSFSDKLYKYIRTSKSLKELIKVNSPNNELNHPNDYANLIRECYWKPNAPECLQPVSLATLSYLTDLIIEAENQLTRQMYKQEQAKNNQQEEQNYYQQPSQNNQEDPKYDDPKFKPWYAKRPNRTQTPPRQSPPPQPSRPMYTPPTQSKQINYDSYINNLTLEQQKTCRAMDAINYKSKNRNVVCKENGINPKYQLTVHPDKNIGCNEFSNIINKDIGNYCNSN